jgi:serine O-acetyltransferase
MLKDMKADAFRILGRASLGSVLWLAISNRTFRPVFTLRLCQWSAKRFRSLSLLTRILHRWTQAMAGMDLPSTIVAGPGLCLVHGWGLVVNKDARLGSNVTLFNGVVLGRKDTITADGRDTAYPVVGNEVWIGAHAIVIGVKIGDGAIVGPGTVVTKDVPPHCVVVGNPARILRENAPPDVMNRAPLGESDCQILPSVNLPG